MRWNENWFSKMKARGYSNSQIRKIQVQQHNREVGRMAYRRNGRYYYGRARTFARRNYRYGGKNFGLIASPAFIIGGLLGMTDLDEKIPAPLTLGLASMPFRGKGIGQVKAGFQGIIIGNLIQQYVLKKTVSQAAAGWGL